MQQTKRTNLYSNEKVIFGIKESSLSLLNPYRQAILFFKRELDSFEKNKKLKILDMGCGAGSKTIALKKYFPDFEFWGCDISKKAISYANRSSAGINFFVADAQKLPVKTGSFDIILAYSVLDHLDNPGNGMSEAFRILKNGGTFLFTDPLEAGTLTIHSFFTRFFPSFRSFRRNRLGHTIAFSKDSLITMIQKAGFRVESTYLDWFYLRQVIDIAYYSIMALAGKGPEFTVDKIISGKKTNLSKYLEIARSVVSFFENLESELMRGFPYGFFIYIRAKK